MKGVPFHEQMGEKIWQICHPESYSYIDLVLCGRICDRLAHACGSGVPYSEPIRHTSRTGLAVGDMGDFSAFQPEYFYTDHAVFLFYAWDPAGA